MNWIIRRLLALLLSWMLAACSAGMPADVPAMLDPAPDTALAISATPVRTGTPGKTVAVQALPPCSGMQTLQNPVQFDWPNLDEHRQEFSRSRWAYYACQQSAEEVAARYRQALTQPPYSMEETNWLDRQEGTLGVFFAQTGAWQYIWFVPQPEDPQASYVIVAITFAYVEC